MFKEIKKNLVLSKKKMAEVCKTFRKYKVKMVPNIRRTLQDIDNLLDDDYETIRIKVKETVTEQLYDCEYTKEKKLSTGEKKQLKKIVEVEGDVTLLKGMKGFLDQMAEERHLWNQHTKLNQYRQG